MKLSEAIRMVLKSIVLSFVAFFGLLMIVGGFMMASGVDEFLVVEEEVLSFSSRVSGALCVPLGIFFEVVALLLSVTESEPMMVTIAVIISQSAGLSIILFSHGELWMIEVVSGIVVLISAIMLKIRPGEDTHGFRTCCRIWGTMILIFSIISFFAEPVAIDLRGSFRVILRGLFRVISETLGIIGGALALIGAQKRREDRIRPIDA